MSGYYNFGNNASDGYQARPHEYTPAWEKQVDYNPDHQPSSGAIFIETMGADILGVFQVRGLGVLILRATPDLTDPLGKLKFTGLSIFTKADIGYSPQL
jgi:hypothetical protein